MPNMASAGGYSSPDGRVRAEERMLHDRDWRGTPPWVVDKRRPWTPFAEVKPPTARDRPLVSALHAPRNSTPILTGCGEVTDFDGSVQRGGPPCNPIGERGRSGPADAVGPGKSWARSRSEADTSCRFATPANLDLSGDRQVPRHQRRTNDSFVEWRQRAKRKRWRGGAEYPTGRTSEASGVLERGSRRQAGDRWGSAGTDGRSAQRIALCGAPRQA
jgi:hypothetical protein